MTHPTLLGRGRFLSIPNLAIECGGTEPLVCSLDGPTKSQAAGVAGATPPLDKTSTWKIMSAAQFGSLECFLDSRPGVSWGTELEVTAFGEDLGISFQLPGPRSESP